MGGAQPLAATLCGATYLGVDVDPARVARRLAGGYLDEIADSPADAIGRVIDYARRRVARSVGVVANIGTVLAELIAADVTPDVLTDQTSAHDPRNGYVPHDCTLQQVRELRESNPEALEVRARQSIARHVSLMLEFQRRGAVTFDYGNNLRGVAAEAGLSEAFRIPGFVPEFIRPLFCEGSGPFRWVALSGDPADIAVTDEALLEAFPGNSTMQNWLRRGAPRVRFQGLPARICWLR